MSNQEDKDLTWEELERRQPQTQVIEYVEEAPPKPLMVPMEQLPWNPTKKPAQA